MIGYLDISINLALIFIISKISGYVEACKVEDKINKLMSFRIDDKRLLEKSIWTKIEDLKNIKSNFLPVYDDRYIKTKIRA